MSTGQPIGGPRTQIVADAVGAEMVQTNSVTMNVAQRTLVITEDRLELCLMKNIPKLETSQAWVAPFAVLLTIIIVLVTSTFHDFLLPASVWHAIFWLSLLAAAIWTFRSGLKARRSVSVQELLGMLRTAGTTQLALTGTSSVQDAKAPDQVMVTFQCSRCGAALHGTSPQVCPTCGTMN